MNKKVQPVKVASKVTAKKTPSSEPFLRADRLKILSYVLGLLLLISVFKNISYPLFWADESTTAVGAERVIKYGYPKAHDGKNVLNDMYCNTPKIAVNEKDDAFIGGANWGQYYFGAIGCLLARSSDDMYTQTGILRSSFAIMGLLGLFLLGFVLSNFFEDKFSKYLFISLFLLAELISASMVLHLRQARYYPLALFFSSSILALYAWHRFHKPLHKIVYSIALAALLWIMFNVFSPLYFIFILAIGIAEAAMALFQYMKTKNVKEAAMSLLPTLAAIAVSFIGVYPLLRYFKTFEMVKILNDFYQFNSDKYWYNFSYVLKYFSKLELLWLAVAMRAFVVFNFTKITKLNSGLFRLSNFFTLLIFLFIFSVPNIATGIFTRYFIYMQPVIAIIAISDFILLLNLFSGTAKKTGDYRIPLLVAVFTGFFGFTLAENFSFLEGHLYEMTHQTEGPLDYTIPYIKTNYPKPEDLIIATNYEETSFMYYLKSKVILGYVGNNLPEDTIYQPQIISFRGGGNSKSLAVFNQFLQKAAHQKVVFPIKDIYYNTIPELNVVNTNFDHNFRSVFADSAKDQTVLYIKM